MGSQWERWYRRERELGNTGYATHMKVCGCMACGERETPKHVILGECVINPISLEPLIRMQHEIGKAYKAIPSSTGLEPKRQLGCAA